MKVKWDKEILEKLIEEKIPYELIGKKYGVSGNAVKKAAKKLGIKLLQRRKINPKEHFNKKNIVKNKPNKVPKNVDSYTLKEDEKISIIKYPNYNGKRVLRKCEYCGCIFETLVLKVRSKGEKFCSKECYIAYRKKNAMNDDEKKIKGTIYQKKSKYGLSETEYKELFIKQNNKCAICGCEFNSKNKGFVDHSHDTNKVRGLLCTRCNTILGMAKDNTLILENAIKYLNNNNSKS